MANEPKSGVVKWPSYLAVIPLLVLAFAPGRLSPFVAVPITASLSALGVFLSLRRKPAGWKLSLTALGFVLSGAAAGLIAFILSLRL